jgi:hypothetical protein
MLALSLDKDKIKLKKRNKYLIAGEVNWVGLAYEQHG